MPKNAQTTAQLHSSHTLEKQCSKFSKPVCELRTPRCSSWSWKGRGTRDQIANLRWIIEKAREFQKNIYFCFIDYAKAFNYVDHNKLWKILKEIGVPGDLHHCLWNMYASQEAALRTGHGTTDWLQIGKGVCQGCTLSPCLFNLYMQSTSCKMLGWMKHKLGSRLREKYQ